MNKSTITIRVPSTSELGQVAAVHVESFRGFFLTSLGPSFLRLLYDCILSDPEGILLVAASDSGIDGFVAGVTQQEGFYKRVLRSRKWAFAWAASGACIRRPLTIFRLLRALRRPAEAIEYSTEACLMSIAVCPQSEGRGIGRRLVRAFNEELVKRGATSVCLTTDSNDNERTNYFYQQLGFRLSRTFLTPEGRAMNEYVLPLKPSIH